MRRRDFFLRLMTLRVLLGGRRVSVLATQQPRIRMRALSSSAIIPADRLTVWNPGVTYNGGIPTDRTQFGTTLTPSGGNDYSQIQNAINACPANRFVLLGPGTFQITGSSPLIIGQSNITLRGSGAGVTILHRTDGAVDGSFNTNANAPTLIAGPNGRFPSGAGFASFNLVSDGVHGAFSITVSGASAGTFVVGQILLLDELANESYVPSNDGHGTNILQSDDGLLTWAAWSPEVNPGGIQEDARTNAYSRDHRIVCEYKEVASWNSGTGVLTFTSPIHARYRVDHSAQVATFAVADTPLRNIGIESMTIDRGDNGLVYIQNCAYTWLRNVELTKWLGEGVRFFECFRCEIRDSYIHTPVYFEPGGGSYNIAIDTGTADTLVENCISRDANKVVVARGAGAGCVLGYNYMDDGHIGTNPAWQEMGVGGSHFIGCHHMLFEGNWGYNGDNDKTHGNSWGHTYFRNHLTGRRTNYESQVTGRCGGVTRTTKKMSFVGNVMGLSGQMSGLVYETGSQSVAAVWRMGWDDWSPNTPDPAAVADTIRDGNYDHLTGEVRWHGQGGAVGAGIPKPLPNSLYLAQKPPFFGVSTWPWVDALGATKTFALPAKDRYDAGTPNVVPVTWPISADSGGRYLVDAYGTPFPVLGRTLWAIVTRNTADYRTMLDDTAARGYNAIEMQAVNRHDDTNNVPFDGSGNVPFTKRLDGANYTGSLTYGNINNEAADFTFPNAAYWANLDALLNYAKDLGIVVLLFPAYVGYQGGTQGWMQEMTANGTTKMQTYGAWIASRYRNQGNLIWMIGGDLGTSPNFFTTAQKNIESALITGIQSVTPQSTSLFSAEWTTESIGTDQTDYGGTVINFNSAYSWAGDVSNQGRRAYAYATRTIPSFLLEEPYDEEGPDGTNFNPNATQPVRRFQWWGWLSTRGGYVAGNGYVNHMNTGWQSHLDTQGSRDMARLNAFVRSIPWHRLIPSGFGGVGTLVTAGSGAVSSTTYVAASVTVPGTLMVAYIPPAHAGSITIDMSKMSGLVTARWFDPTSGLYTAIGSGFANSGTRVFTPTGNNSAGQADWVLRLDA